MCSFYFDVVETVIARRNKNCEVILYDSGCCCCSTHYYDKIKGDFYCYYFGAFLWLQHWITTWESFFCCVDYERDSNRRKFTHTHTRPLHLSDTYRFPSDSETRENFPSTFASTQTRFFESLSNFSIQTEFLCVREAAVIKFNSGFMYARGEYGAESNGKKDMGLTTRRFHTKN